MTSLSSYLRCLPSFFQRILIMYITLDDIMLNSSNTLSYSFIYNLNLIINTDLSNHKPNTNNNDLSFHTMMLQSQDILYIMSMQEKMAQIDLRSDTVTVPTQQMKIAIKKYLSLQSQDTDDQTIMSTLEREAAQITGKQNGCFVVSGTFGNQCSMFTVGNPGDQVLLSDACHIIQYENASIAKISRLITHTLPHTSGKISISTLQGVLNSKKSNKPKIFCIENPTTKGSLYNLQEFLALTSLAKSHGCHVHMDGARLFNACGALNISPIQLLSHVDSVMFCLSKGLCSPVGSVVVGSNDFINKFKIKRSIMGGNIKKPGILGVVGLIALREMRNQVKKDNLIAHRLSELFNQFKWIEVTEKVQTNMLFFKFTDKRVQPLEIANIFRTNKIKCHIDPLVGSVNRFVLHHYVGNEEINFIVTLLKKYEDIMSQ